MRASSTSKSIFSKTVDCIMFFLPIAFEKLGANLTPESLYIEKEKGVWAQETHKFHKSQ